MKHPKLACLACALALALGTASCGDKNESSLAKPTFSEDKITLSGNSNLKTAPFEGQLEKYSGKAAFKWEKNQNNTLITNLFCADPTSVEYDGRLYVYGTNDNQQYLEKGGEDNSYEKIKSFVIISTDDMVNWRYEGLIDTASIAPWIIASWAPSITSRVEEDGLTHFYLYFSNSGAGVGVLTATSPTGPWSDPLGEPLIKAGMKGLDGCPNPFDPGVCIDDDGVGWLAFGGGRARGGTDYMPGSARICRLGQDMLSIDSEFSEIKAPYFFEASELNYIGGTYVYTYNTSWETRLEWDQTSLVYAPPACSMAYMTSKTPLDTDSWEYRDYYLQNPGELGMEYSNNHTHLHKYKDNYYILFHTLMLQKELGITHGFRSLCADRAEVDEEKALVLHCYATPEAETVSEGMPPLDPYKPTSARTAFFTDCEYSEEGSDIYVKCSGSNIIGIKNADFGEGSTGFAAKVKGNGTLALLTGSPDSEPVTVLSFDCADWTNVYDELELSGSKEYLFFELSGDFLFDEWEFTK